MLMSIIEYFSSCDLEFIILMNFVENTSVPSPRYVRNEQGKKDLSVLNVLDNRAISYGHA